MQLRSFVHVLCLEGYICNVLQVHVNNTKGYTAKAEQDMQHRSRAMAEMGHQWIF